MKNSKPIIAYISIGWHISGGTRIIFEHANRLAQRGYSVFLISNDLSFDTSWFKFNENVKFFDYNKPQDWIRDIDIIFATYNETLWYIIDLPTRIKKGYFNQTDERHFYPADSMEYYLADQTYRFKGLYYYTEADWIHEWLKKDYDIDAPVIKNKINNKNFYVDKSPKFSSLKPIVLVEGNAHVFKKGIQDASKALESLSVDCEKWLLTSAMGELPSHTKIYDRIFQSPSQEDIRKIYSGADILLKPSHFEGSPLPHMEAMCCGTAVLTTNCNGVNEYCTHMENSYIVETGDIAAMHEATERLLTDIKLRKRLIKNGLEYAKKYLYNWDEEIDKLEDFINKINEEDQYFLYYSHMLTRKLLESNFLSHKANTKLNEPVLIIKKFKLTEKYKFLLMPGKFIRKVKNKIINL